MRFKNWFILCLVLLLVPMTASCSGSPKTDTLYYVQPEMMGDYEIDLSVFSKLDKYREVPFEERDDVRIPEGKEMTVSVLGEEFNIVCYEYNKYYDWYSGKNEYVKFDVSASSGRLISFEYNTEKLEELDYTLPENEDAISEKEAVAFAEKLFRDIFGDDIAQYNVVQIQRLYIPGCGGKGRENNCYRVLLIDKTTDGWRLGQMITWISDSGKLISFFTPSDTQLVEQKELPADFSNEKIEEIIRKSMKNADQKYELDDKVVWRENGRMVARCTFYPVTDGVRENGYSIVIPLE